MEFKAGDIIGFSGDTPVNDLINVATWGVPRWGLSHVGIVAPYDYALALFESTSLAPAGSKCIVQRKHVKGVQAHWLSDVRMRTGKIWHYPLSRALSDDESKRLTEFLLSQIGRGYDFRGAARSGGGVMLRAAALLFKQESLDDEFCSELTAAAYSALGLLPTRNASAYNPNSFTRHARRAGVLQSPARVL